MAEMKTEYLGLTLRNPLIVGSSGLTKTVDGVKECADAGAGAVVLKSLFEEQIRMDFAEATASDYAHPDTLAYLKADMAVQFGPRNYLNLIEKASKAVDIPVIASVNCVSPEHWVSFATQIEAAGAAALELNLHVPPHSFARTSEEMETVYRDAVKSVRARTRIPLAVKLSPYFTNTYRIALQLQEAGADGLVLFNRLFSPDVDLQKLELVGGLTLSSPEEYHQSLRWTALLHGRLKCNLCSATGVHDGATAMKMILAGADAVQVTSTLYRNKRERLAEMLAWMDAWMAEKGFNSISEVRGKLSRARTEQPQLLERAQYIKAFVGVE